MSTFYFTYEGVGFLPKLGDPPYRQPYKGGWTEVEAPSAISAHGIYLDVHPQARGRECYWFYNRVFDEDEFRKCGFAETGINGYKCVERITVNREIVERGAINVE